MLRSLVVLARGLIPLKQFVDTIVAPMLAGLAGAEPPKPPERGDEPMDPRVRAYCIWLFGLRYALQVRRAASVLISGVLGQGVMP